jgi:uncharacterized membrane protein
MNYKLYKKLLDRTFEIGILAKSIFGFFEVLVGIAIAFSGRLIVDNLIILLTQQEIAEDPKDFFSNYLIKVSNDLSAGSHIFAVTYLIFHGTIDVFLAIFLLKGKYWAYPVALGLFSLFLIYQIYRCFDTHSLLLELLTVFDAFIIFFVFLEYKKRTKKQR